MSNGAPAPIDTEPDNLSKNPFARFGVYAILLIGSVIFAWPFVWMIATSFKLDRELARDPRTVVPDLPVVEEKSPYVENGLFRGMDFQVEKEKTAAILAHLEGLDYAWPEGVAKERMQSVAEAVGHRLAELVPSSDWDLPQAGWENRVLPRIDGQVLDQAVEKARRVVLMSRLTARSWDVQESVLVAGDEVARGWKVSGPAKLVQGKEGKASAELHYDFTQGDQFQLEGTFDLGFKAERLYRLNMSMRMDNTWHPLKAQVEMKGKTYQAEDIFHLGDDRWTAILLQEPGPDDETNKIKTWALLHEIGPGSVSDPGKVKITLTITQGGFLDALWLKLKRNYRFVLDNIPFGRYVATSAFLVILNMLGTVLSCSIVAYAFSRLRWPGRRIGFGIMLGTMMIPPQVTMIPFFLIVRHLGWYNTLYPLWVGSFFANAFFVFLLYQFFRGIPKDLEDAARIDGCGPIRTYWYIMLPLIKPALATVAIFTFLGVWNDFMGPLIYVSDQRLYPLSLGLYAFNVESGAAMTMMMAGSLMMTLPVILIFFFAQRYFIQGITMSGIKG